MADWSYLAPMLDRASLNITVRRGWRSDLVNLFIFACATLATLLAQSYERPITAVLAYLTGVIIVGARSGLWRGLFAALAAATIYNFALSDPVLRFGVTTIDELVPLIAFTICALVTGGLAGRLNDIAEEARAAQAENARLMEALYEERARRQSEKLKDLIFSSVSHDLRTPLTAIEAAAESLQATDFEMPAEQRRTLLATIVAQCRRLNRLTADLLDVGRIQSGISREGFNEAGLVEILGVALGRLRATYPDVRIDKELDAAGSAAVLANPAMLEQALFNILENAVVHGGPASTIAITADCSPEQCSVSICDNGPGIPAEEQARVFERFHRADAAKSRPGSGLGLFIARGFVDAFGGSLSLVSPVADNRGTCVILALPLARAEMTEGTP